jgi:hypothetical protein
MKAGGLVRLSHHIDDGFATYLCIHPARRIRTWWHLSSLEAVFPPWPNLVGGQTKKEEMGIICGVEKQSESPTIGIITNCRNTSEAFLALSLLRKYYMLIDA